MLFSRSKQSASMLPNQEQPGKLKQQLKRTSEERMNSISSTDPSSVEATSSATTFQPSFEKNVNKELEAGLPAPPPFQERHVDDYIPPPPGPPPPPFVIPAPRWQSGIYVPAPIFILLMLIFLLETTVIVFYTAVALYSTLPAAGFHLPSQRAQACQQPMNFYLANTDPGREAAASPPAEVTVTATPTRTFSTIPAITPTVAFTTIYSTTNVPASSSATP
ncbi:hypothetical protein K461DRAFT_312160 [Myriangium duriaei CBS 260.36]|uniref:Uncharacterized protein n=1 Tax=Myriangium duriaei CBS 260.36 TaxID=1168546 RepID=A0A9P4J434_9PEZI|nr:hypothetical protein K461DRAFT_312160 [Myriangium duriaei CBS 260.36]